jgi:hypothetical protein
MNKWRVQVGKLLYNLYTLLAWLWYQASWMTGPVPIVTFLM